jgi:hypothetical protein
MSILSWQQRATEKVTMTEIAAAVETAAEAEKLRTRQLNL